MNVVTRLQVEQQPKFDDLKNLWPAHRRGSIPLARVRWDQLTGGPWRTRIKDHEAGEVVPVEYERQDPAAIIEAAKRYIQSKCLPNQTYAEMWSGKPRLQDDGRYLQHISTWLNRGGWME